jgi:6-phospho-beta-glucosidase
MGTKLAYIGGGGVRTPLVVFGVNEAAKELDAEELCLFDVDRERVDIMGALGNAIVARESGTLRVRVAESLEDALADSSFVMDSVRVGLIAGRAHDEVAARDCGYPGQETTGPAGIAMGLRNIPAVVAHARLMERYCPQAWLVSFTNPAGLVTQAVNQYTGAKVVGICDTPNHLFHRIADALEEPFEDVRCEYLGLNHLGWVRSVSVRGQDVTARMLASDDILERIYPAKMFDGDMIRELGLIPTEYLYFYYERSKALANQVAQGSTRGTEILELNDRLFRALRSAMQSNNTDEAVSVYVRYLDRRHGSYMRLEAEGGSAIKGNVNVLDEDPFRTAHGYHRVAVRVMRALRGTADGRVVVNSRNQGSVSGISDDDVVEGFATVTKNAISMDSVGELPDSVRGLVFAAKAYEHAVLDAIMSGSRAGVRKAMLVHPAIGEWTPSLRLTETLMLGALFGTDLGGRLGSCGDEIMDVALNAQ